jgi:hypothetical protein
MVDQLDNYFMNMILQYGSGFEDVIDKSLDYDINLPSDIAETLFKEDIEIKNIKTKEISKYNIAFFSLYNFNTEEFMWYRGIEKIFSEQLNKYSELYSIPFIRNLFATSKIKMGEKYKNVIPYLVAIIYPNYNVIRFTDPDNNLESYILINLGIKDSFDFDKFSELLSNYNLISKNINDTKEKSILSRNKKIEKGFKVTKNISKKLIENKDKKINKKSTKKSSKKSSKKSTKKSNKKSSKKSTKKSSKKTR